MISRRVMALSIVLVLSAGISISDASVLTITPQGGGLFLLQGAGLENVAAMDITVHYDAGSLGNPRIEQGELIAGAMMAVNAGVPGSIRIAIIRLTPITGSGNVVALTFDPIGSAPNPIKGLTVKLSDINGLPLQAQAQVATAPDPASSASRQQSAPQVAELPRAAVTVPQGKPTVSPLVAPGGIITAPESDVRPQEIPPVVLREPVQPGQEPPVTTTDVTARRDPDRVPGPATREMAVFTQKSALDLFREYRGPRTPKDLIALFKRDVLIGCRQEPSPFVSDGKKALKVIFIAPAVRNGTPDIALLDAALVSLERDRENTNTWIAVVRPKRNALEVKLTVHLPDIAMVIPLAVAPQTKVDLDGSGTVTEADFALYLKRVGEKGQAGRDLNSDGAVTYLDDFIFTANYLRAQERAQAIRRLRKSKHMPFPAKGPQKEIPLQNAQ
jgi:hypothetical protein